MPSVAAIAAAHYRERQALVRAADAAAKRLWEGLDPHSLRLSWTAATYALTAVLVQAQHAAAAASTSYVSDVLGQQDVDAGVQAVNPAAFAGVASDGRPLATLLEQPLISTLVAIGRGVDLGTALLAGETSVRMIAGTQVADAGRAADGVAITGSQHGGYVRMLNPPSCSRCAVLAGRWYRWNAGFKRHPRCDCTAIPAAENIAGDLVTSPKAYFASLSSADQNRIFTNAGAQAIRDGADIGQVVNVRRKGAMYTAGGRDYTTESTSRRGTSPGVRIMPEQIYRDADGDRARAIELLKQFGYIL